MVPLLPINIEDLDNVGQLLYESLVVSRLDEEIICRGEVEGLGGSGGGEVDLRRRGGSVPHGVVCRAPVKCLQSARCSAQV